MRALRMLPWKWNRADVAQYLLWFVNITLVTVSVRKCDIIRICVVSVDVVMSLDGHVI